MTEIANPALGKIEDLVKDLAWDNLVKATLVYLKLDFWPVNAIATLFTDKLYESLRTTVDLAAISLVNEHHQRGFDRALVTLAIVARDKGMESDEYRKAKENAKTALSQFVRFRGV